MKKRRTIWQWLRDWWTPDDEEDADGYPGDVCPWCGGQKEIMWITHSGNSIPCPACKGKGTV